MLWTNLFVPGWETKHSRRIKVYTLGQKTMVPPGYGAHPNELEHLAKAANTNSFIECPNAKSAEFVTERANAVNSVDQYSPSATEQCAS